MDGADSHGHAQTDEKDLRATLSAAPAGTAAPGPTRLLACAGALRHAVEAAEVGLSRDDQPFVLDDVLALAGDGHTSVVALDLLLWWARGRCERWRALLEWCNRPRNASPATCTHGVS